MILAAQLAAAILSAAIPDTVGGYQPAALTAHLIWWAVPYIPVVLGTLWVLAEVIEFGYLLADAARRLPFRRAARIVELGA